MGANLCSTLEMFGTRTSVNRGMRAHVNAICTYKNTRNVFFFKVKLLKSIKPVRNLEKVSNNLEKLTLVHVHACCRLWCALVSEDGHFYAHLPEKYSIFLDRCYQISDVEVLCLFSRPQGLQISFSRYLHRPPLQPPVPWHVSPGTLGKPIGLAQGHAPMWAKSVNSGRSASLCSMMPLLATPPFLFPRGRPSISSSRTGHKWGSATCLFLHPTHTYVMNSMYLQFTQPFLYLFYHFLCIFFVQTSVSILLVFGST